MVYKWYILPIGGLYATYHLLGEPQTTIDGSFGSFVLEAILGLDISMIYVYTVYIYIIDI